MRKLLSIFALTVATLVAVPGAALGYGATESATVTDASPAPGEPFLFIAQGFQANSTVTVSVNSDDATIVQAATTTQQVSADSAGVSRASVAIDDEGQYTVAASGTGADGQPLTVAATVTVGDGTAASRTVSDGGNEALTDDSSLPRTGADGVATQLWAGVGLLAVGGVLVGLTLRRRMTA